MYFSMRLEENLLLVCTGMSALLPLVLNLSNEIHHLLSVLLFYILYYEDYDSANPNSDQK